LPQTDGKSEAYVAFVRTTGHRLMTAESFHALFDGSAFGVILMDTVGVIKVTCPGNSNVLFRDCAVGL
jgi:hypothetical protein